MLATAKDQIALLRDPRVQVNPGYLVIILLSRVITQLGEVEHINPKVIEGLFVGDLAYLQDLYRRVNEHGHSRLGMTCPHCQGDFEVETSSGGVMRYPLPQLHEEVAYLAYYLHWSYEQIMHMEHHERQQWVWRSGPHQYAVKRVPGATWVSTGRTVPRGSPPEVALCHPTGHRGNGSDPYLPLNFVVEIDARWSAASASEAVCKARSR